MRCSQARTLQGSGKTPGWAVQPFLGPATKQSMGSAQGSQLRWLRKAGEHLQKQPYAWTTSAWEARGFHPPWAQGFHPASAQGLQLPFAQQGLQWPSAQQSFQPFLAQGFESPWAWGGLATSTLGKDILSHQSHLRELLFPRSRSVEPLLWGPAPKAPWGEVAT